MPEFHITGNVHSIEPFSLLIYADTEKEARTIAREVMRLTKGKFVQEVEIDYQPKEDMLHTPPAPFKEWPP